MSRVVVLDCEAVQALADPAHPHHRRVVAHTQVVTTRKRRSVDVTVVVPTAVRVEADIDRTAPGSAFFNGLRTRDVPLDTAAADTAASLHRRHRVSVPDAHVGATIQAVGADTEVTVVTSDPGDMRRVSGSKRITTVKV